MFFDKETVIKKLIDEGMNKESADRYTAAFGGLCEALQKIVEKWAENEEFSWEYQGVTLEKICSLEGVGMPDAFLHMQAIMEIPGMAEKYAEQKVNYIDGLF